VTLTDWSEAQRWLQEVAGAEYVAQKRAHRKARRAASTFRWTPPPWLRQATDALGHDDIETFKFVRIKVTLGETTLGIVVLTPQES
jgi:hypothetical protein